MRNKYKSILFDLDGTLTDSGPGITRCASLALDAMGIAYPSKEALGVFVGPPLVCSFSRFGVPEDRIEEAIRIFRTHYNAGGKFENTPYEGIRELLGRLQQEGYKIYVATSKPEGTAKEVLNRFGMTDYFDEICGATLDHSRENKSAVIAYLLEKIGGAGRPVMIGDTVFDVQGAAKFGIPCIGVTWGYGVEQEMRDAGAVGIARTMEELYELLH
ncbi:MAG: HAD-IA family hydrolase [Lachnospiraceae bacterium]|nr:HAD-IA family hydrolase [Lachnospiraceae bacterium]